MNLDRLIKLLKLANHNSVDGEANSAARAACKILAEDNYKWIEEANKNGGRAPRTAADKVNEFSVNWDEDIRTGLITIKVSQLDIANNPEIGRLIRQLRVELQERPKTWNDVRRSSEPFWRSKPPNSDWDPFYNFYRHYKPPWNSADWDTPKEPQKPSPKEQPRWTWTKQDENGNTRYKKVYNQRNRDCSVCGMTKFTADESNPYICADCKWKKYEAEKGKT